VRIPPWRTSRRFSGASLFFFALATIALGNGLFLPSLPSQIDGLYRPDDQRRGWAYNVYYVGINIGGFLAPLICGTLGEFYGWHWGFGAAGIGMLTGLLIYILGGRYLPDQIRIARNAAAPARVAVPPALTAAVSPAAVAPPAVSSFRSTFILLFGVGVAVTVFRGAYEQVGNIVALWADVGINRAVGVMSIPMTWFQALNPLLVILMTPMLLARWRREADAGRVDSSMKKMALGALIVAAAMLFALDGAIRRIEAARAAEITALGAIQPELA
jgi:POT family proton-dependent oligopeptide transporter